MNQNKLRLTANGIITVFSILLITARLKTVPSDGYYWFWGLPALLILFLDIYFLTKSMLKQPKDIDTRLSSFIIGVGGTMGFGLSALFINQPPIAFLPELRQIGQIIAVTPYPFIFWALFCLKDCLTVIPEAHGVVARGIYKYSRHPLYVCYIIWAIANMLMFLSWAMLAISISHIIVLILRIKREEKLLLATFPEYQTYYLKTGLIGKLRLKCLLEG